jgi:hypothetical protein
MNTETFQVNIIKELISNLKFATAIFLRNVFNFKHISNEA